MGGGGGCLSTGAYLLTSQSVTAGIGLPVGEGYLQNTTVIQVIQAIQNKYKQFKFYYINTSYIHSLFI